MWVRLVEREAILSCELVIQLLLLQFGDGLLRFCGF